MDYLFHFRKGSDIVTCQYKAAIHRVDDRHWEAIVDLLPTHLAVRARNRAQDYRTFLEGVLWVVGEEAFWAELPECFGHHWRTLYVRSLRWNHVVIGRDSALARSLMRRSDHHTAIVRRRRMRNLPWMFEGLREANRRANPQHVRAWRAVS